MSNVQPYSILVGVGQLYRAAVGEPFPNVDAVPGANWTNMGNTDGGVTVTLEQTLAQHRVDQSTGPKKVTRSEENLIIETNLAQATLENLASLLTEAVVDTPPGTTTIGTREVNLYRGFTVQEFTLLFRGISPYGPWPAQFQVPRGYFDGAVAIGHTKDAKQLFAARFVALEDPDAASAVERFGKLKVQDAVATG